MSGKNGNVDFRIIQRAAIAGVIVLVAISVVVWWLFRYWEGKDERVDVRRTLVATDTIAPSEPPLQVNPRMEWKQFRQEQLEQLNSYGWVSRDDRRVRIPIERAMELLVEREK